MESILLIISICVLIMNITILVKLTAYLKTLNKKQNLSNVETSNDNINLDEILNSLEFNTHLDELIRPLLGKYNNKDIVDKVSEYIIKHDLKNADENKIKNYVSDVLLNYNNHIDQYETESTYLTEEIIDYPDKNISSESVNNTDMARALNNFYK